MKQRLRLSELYDLEDLALETGASVEFADGRKFNTSKVQAKRVKEEPVEKPVARADNTAEILKQIVLLLSRPVEVVVPPMPAPQVTVSLPPKEEDEDEDESEDKPVQWVFEFERNYNGTIKRITATPTMKESLN
jgi:hypothetical protein